jgi:hypothetical protein
MDLHALRDADLTLDELIARLRELARRLEEIIRTELVSSGPPPDVEVTLEPTSEPTASPSPFPTTSPETSPSPSPTGG